MNEKEKRKSEKLNEEVIEDLHGDASVHFVQLVEKANTVINNGASDSGCCEKLHFEICRLLEKYDLIEEKCKEVVAVKDKEIEILEALVKRLDKEIKLKKK